jgi:hypothetical protein
MSIKVNEGSGDVRVSCVASTEDDCCGVFLDYKSLGKPLLHLPQYGCAAIDDPELLPKSLEVHGCFVVHAHSSYVGSHLHRRLVSRRRNLKIIFQVRSIGSRRMSTITSTKQQLHPRTVASLTATPQRSQVRHAASDLPTGLVYFAPSKLSTGQRVPEISQIVDRY